MKRAVTAVIVGYVVWTAIWLGGNAVLLGDAAEAVQEGERYDAIGPLAGALVLSVVCSLAAGVATAVIARRRSRGALVTVAALLLVTGLGVQAGVWSLMPLWYHVVFLALLAPGVLAGGKLARSRAGAA